jgi:glycine oxidase
MGREAGMDDPDVIVAGAGIVGLSAARALAGAGARVIVVDRGRPGTEASSAAAGWLAAQAEAAEGWPLFDLALRARERHLRLADELREETGLDAELSRGGTLEVAFTDDDERVLAHRVAWQRARGLVAEALGPDEVRRLEPRLSPAARGAILFRADRSVDNVRLTQAIAASAAARGAVVLSGQPVTGLLVVDGRTAGVRTGAETVRAPIVIEAMGAWSAALAGDPDPPPVEPVRGQILAFDTAPDTLRHVVCTSRGYVVPRASGRLLAGSTLERVGFVNEVTAEGRRAVGRIAAEIAPLLESLPVADCWAGLRPGTPDGLPIVGPGALPGLFHATGLYRNGILLGPLFGEAVARLALGLPPEVDLGPFSLSRFRPRSAPR